ncbi:PAS domain S-box protein [Archangium violaceum]|uniref:PAS domain-containing hybrid sensor histidine kinase/response regulator n=1 Tax=Archangium violaceum TaxID=83451 RepID=UPI00193C3A17|nr:PAS domain-containing hybrid sensor histidine kinase/response regulator [Archangium violaceum]QRK05699.1 PAS domain S-box protein [Archangium violaceum]
MSSSASASWVDESQLLHLLASHAAEAFYLMDEKGLVTYANPAAERMFGWSREEMLGKVLHDLIHHHHSDGRPFPMSTCRLGLVMTEGRTLKDHEDLFIHRDGSFIPVYCSNAPILAEGRIVGAALVVHDLTARKRAEEARAEQARQFQLLIDTLPHLAWMSRADGTCEFVNRPWHEYTGLSMSESLGYDWTRVVHPEDLPRMLEHWQRVLGTGERYEAEIRIRRARDGEWRWFLSRAQPARAADGRILRWIGSCTDIDEQRRAAQERLELLRRVQAAHAAAEEANRLKDDFLATVSHELRTPLTAMLGWLQLLRTGRLSEEKRGRALETVERNARAQAQVIEDLLDISRIITGKLHLEPGPLDMKAVVEAALESTRPLADTKGVTLELQTGAEPLPMRGDAGRLQQVVWNLVNNAIKFTPREGRVTVQLGPLDGVVELRVMDTGMGISPSFLPHIFERFRQEDGSSRRAHGGLGLGLAIVHHLVELHGGRVSAHSPGEGHGATFVLHLPREPRPAPPLPPAPPGSVDAVPPVRSALAGLRLLLVEDQEDTREMLRLLLEGHGAQLRAVSSAAEAFRCLREWRPELLVSDIGLPGENGYELLQRIRALPDGEGGLTPAIALTAYARAEDRAKALRAGFDMHVPKPVEEAELLAVLAAATERLRGG